MMESRGKHRSLPKHFHLRKHFRLQFNNFSWVNRVPKSIVVGIANVDRKRDFTYPTTIAEDLKKYPATGHSDKFIAFIQQELQPFIEKKYKANTSRTIIGPSLADCSSRRSY